MWPKNMIIKPGIGKGYRKIPDEEFLNMYVWWKPRSIAVGQEHRWICGVRMKPNKKVSVQELYDGIPPLYCSTVGETRGADLRLQLIKDIVKRQGFELTQQRH